MGRLIRGQISKSITKQVINDAHCWGIGTMLWCTHCIMCRVWRPSQKGTWYHAQTANIGGMGVRAMVASDIVLQVEVEGSDNDGLEFEARDLSKKGWVPHIGLGPMLVMFRGMSAAVRAHMDSNSAPEPLQEGAPGQKARTTTTTAKSSKKKARKK